MKISKNKLKFIRSLNQKKQRDQNNVFLAEGPKLVEELLQVFPCQYLAATPEWLRLNSNSKAKEVVEVSIEGLKQGSLQQNPQQVLAIFEKPTYKIKLDKIKDSLCLALDDVQSPGNLGTIIRLADWFGIEDVFCSLHTADVYNPKTVQATMGALARVRVHYTPLDDLITKLDNHPIYGAFLEGKPIYNETLSQKGLIVMGNEGQGISKEIESLITDKLYIPNYPENRKGSESLNVAVASAIICAEFRRQALCQQY
ncbi:MAG: RNA methyltransferase [Bacteroides sp.]|nr:RNA methyltransferase [Bacteroides sp.]MDD4719969.1 RNA methyltransferase [Bacteroides sp.]NLI63249.1 RNA methyltransferase [Bacteroidales bacterium]